MIEETYQGNKLFTARTDIEEIAASLDFSKSTVVDYSVRTSQNKYYSVYVSFDNFQQFSSFYLIEEELPDCIRGPSNRNCEDTEQLRIKNKKRQILWIRAGQPVLTAGFRP